MLGVATEDDDIYSIGVWQDYRYKCKIYVRGTFEAPRKEKRSNAKHFALYKMHGGNPECVSRGIRVSNVAVPKVLSCWHAHACAVVHSDFCMLYVDIYVTVKYGTGYCFLFRIWSS